MLSPMTMLDILAGLRLGVLTIDDAFNWGELVVSRISKSSETNQPSTLRSQAESFVYIADGGIRAHRGLLLVFSHEVVRPNYFSQSHASYTAMTSLRSSTPLK